jgi:hypothetical protein
VRLNSASSILRYCDIVAEIDGVVTRRNVNPGNDVQVGQSLMAIRSLNEIWIDANFKETQLRDLRIGQAVDLYVDGDRQVFNGRIAGFTMGTGSTLALLPPQNGRTRSLCSLAPRLSPTSISISPSPDPMPGSFCRATCSDRRPPARWQARQASTNDRGGPFAHEIARGGKPLGGGRGVVVPTFMEVLDTTITLVALRYIAGGLSATVDDGEWVITSYLAANAIILPITGWLSAHLGRRNYFLLSIAVFTLASAACGMATSLGQLIVFRVVQGLAGGGLQPSSQGVLLDAFPQEKQGIAMTFRLRYSTVAGRRPNARRLDNG